MSWKQRKGHKKDNKDFFENRKAKEKIKMSELEIKIKKQKFLGKCVDKNQNGEWKEMEEYEVVQIEEGKEVRYGLKYEIADRFFENWKEWKVVKLSYRWKK